MTEKEKYYWLEDTAWAEKKKTNILYLAKLRSQLQRFLYSKPVKLKTFDGVDSKNQIGFQIGENIKTYKIDPHLSVHEFCHRLEREFLRPHYPMYKITKTTKREPTEYEIKEMVFRKENPLTFTQATSTQIEEKHDEIGIIEYIEMRNGVFRLNVNGNRTMRSSERTDEGKRISGFLAAIKSFDSDERIHDFIYKHSIEIEDAIKPKTIEIDYSDDRVMLLNFFVERSYSLFNELVYEDSDGDDWWSWDRFRIYMPDEDIKDEARKIVRTMRSKQRGYLYGN